MTQTQAERVADVIIVAAAVGAAIYVLKTPALRRTAWQAARAALASAGPWLVGEARQAWAASRAASGRGASGPDDLPHGI